MSQSASQAYSCPHGDCEGRKAPTVFATSSTISRSSDNGTMTERQPYTVIDTQPGFEVREYPEHLVAEVAVRGSFTSAGNKAFPALAGYIGGRNRQARKVAMTAPVVQEQADDHYVVGFVMPAQMRPEEQPDPTDGSVRTRVVPAQIAAATTFSGRWTPGSYQEHTEALLHALQQAGYEPAGEPRFARYDPPWTPWFLRRNEVIVPVVASG